MQLKQLLNDDDAVSPVIGVILMVAITVILAAVIGTFVLGLGDQVQETAPNTQFDFDYVESNANSNEELEITHTGGDSVAAEELILVNGATRADQGTIGGAWFDTDQVTAGNNVVLQDESSTAGLQTAASTNAPTDASDWDPTSDVQVVWESQSGDTSSTVATWTSD